MYEQAHGYDETADHQLLITTAFWIIWTNSFQGGMLKLNTKFDTELFLYWLSHFECHSHTVHMLTQWCRLPPLTSTVKSSLFTHEHSSPLSLAASLHPCGANCSRYVNNGWAFSRQTTYILRTYCAPGTRYQKMDKIETVLWRMDAPKDAYAKKK